MSKNYNLSFSCCMNSEEKQKAAKYASSKKGQETIPGENITSLAAELDKYPDWIAELADRMYIPASKLYRIKNLAVVDMSLRTEFMNKGQELLNELRA